MPHDYPQSPPRAQGSTSSFLKGVIESTWSEGCECLFQTIEYIREERTQEYFDDTTDGADMQHVFTNADETALLEQQDYEYEPHSSAGFGQIDEEVGLVIHQGPVVEVTKSKFQCFLCVVTSMEEVSAFRRAIVSSKACAKATHNMFAYRFYEGLIAHHDYDDDGETGAASKMAEMLRTMNLVAAEKGIDGDPGRGMAVIVSRWYGGVHLGPARFRIICNTARDLIQELGYLDKDDDKDKGASKASRKKGK